MRAASPVTPTTYEPEEGLPVSGVVPRAAKAARSPEPTPEGAQKATDDAICAAILAVAKTGDMDRARELVDLLLADDAP